MSELHPGRIPTEINLHRKSRVLVVKFADGSQFDLPCEYLRAFSRAAEVRAIGQPVTGKEDVNIERIEPQGQYAVRLVFDDGHDTGIYSWETLYELGANREKNWSEYLAKLGEMGLERRPEDTKEKRRVRILYFSYLVQRLRKDHFDADLPATVGDVKGLLEWLRRRDPVNAHLLSDSSVRITVNKQFCEPFTRLEHGDEVAIVPNSSIAPAAPRARRRS